MIEKTSNIQEAQSDVKQRYDNLIASIDKFSVSLRKIRGKNPELYEMQEKILDEFTVIAEDIKIKATEAIENIPWDHLIIGFFGETNAGKSTIIETFRTLYDSNRTKNSDGLIVGDGRQDFTKDYNTYTFYIDNRKISLVDVPGIEGNEKEYEDKINDALRRVHIIFYVHGKNQRPNEGVAKKISDYLSDWVKVYSIQNVIGRESKYLFPEDILNLITPEVGEISDGVFEDFKRILGKNYIGNLTLQGLIALCSKASFDKSREDLIKTQNKLLKSFGSKSAMFEFSRFKEICNLVKEKSDNFRSEIITANKKKIAAISHRTVSFIYNNVQNNKTNIQSLKSLLKQLKREVKDLEKDTNDKIKREIKADINRTFSRTISEGHNCIDSNEKGKISHLKNIIQNNMVKLSTCINKIQHESILQMENEILYKRKKLKGINLSIVGMPKLKIPFYEIPIEHVIYNLNLNFNDYVNIAFSFGFKYKTIIKERKNSAKRIWSDNINSGKDEYLDQMNDELSKISDKINEYVKRIIRTIEAELKRIDSTEELIREIETDMNLHILENQN